MKITAVATKPHPKAPLYLARAGKAYRNKVSGAIFVPNADVEAGRPGLYGGVWINPGDYQDISAGQAYFPDPDLEPWFGSINITFDEEYHL